MHILFHYGENENIELYGGVRTLQAKAHSDSFILLLFLPRRDV